ncbi:MAG: DUF7133 domain-containing protein [Akkermansiaceae bacterium]
MKKTIITSLISSLSAFSAVAGTTTVPAELETQLFAGPKMTPCPAVIAASPYGDVFVGVDMQGSLGKKPNQGYVAKLLDTNNDGKADKRTVFAKMDNPRGILSIGDRLIVLHSTQKNGKIDTQQLSVYVDADNDGVADGPAKPLVTNIGNPKFIKSRGADHSTNNIRLGIDGWIYISIGDFGFVGAEGTDGTKLSMHGGGIVRVRPDGSEMETFIHGTRNVYDVAIDPFMNVVTRENTNDGVGWWTRFSHYIQNGEYGYPSLYTNFPEDILPALGEYGGGSGCGNMYFEEPGWPEKYNKTFMMTDWGRSHIYIHRVEKDGASFTNEPEDFIGCSQVTDMDVDASGRMYISAWDGAGYSGNPNKGFVSIVTPKNWKYNKFPELTKLSATDLVNLLKTASSTARVYAQQEILRRNHMAYLPHVEAIAADTTVSKEGRVAAIFTYAQLANQLNTDSNAALSKLSADASIKEQCIRAMADRLKTAKQADLNLIKTALNDPEPRVQVAAAVALGRVGDPSAVSLLIEKAVPPTVKVELSDNEADGKSIEITGNQTVDIEVDISTYKELYLIVEGGADNHNDHVAWINPVVVQKFGKSTDMTNYKWKSTKQDFAKTLINKTAYGKPLPNGAKGIGTHANSVIAYKMPAKAVTFKATGILTDPKGSAKFIVSRSPDPSQAGKIEKIHSTPNSAIILPHIATQTLLKLDAQDACIAALSSADENMQRGALAAMKFMHSDKVVDALITAAEKDSALKPLIVDTLIRLHQKEVDYDGSTWWSTRPDPHGPYFYPVDWSATPKISSFINNHNAQLDTDAKAELVTKLKKNRAYVPELNPRPSKGGKVVKKIGTTSIEDIVIHVTNNKGNPANGAKVINKVGCIACHATKLGDPVKGPDLTKLGNMKNADLAEAIIKPGATIAKSWVSITMKDGSNQMGTLVKQDDKEIILHNIAGIPATLDATQVAKTEPGLNMMSLHLCDDLTLKEFADLIAYMKSMDKSAK